MISYILSFFTPTIMTSDMKEQVIFNTREFLKNFTVIDRV